MEVSVNGGSTVVVRIDATNKDRFCNTIATVALIDTLIQSD